MPAGDSTAPDATAVDARPVDAPGSDVPGTGGPGPQAPPARSTDRRSRAAAAVQAWAGAAAQQRLLGVVAPLAARGHHVVPDAPGGSRRARPAVTVVGPAGVHVVATTTWPVGDEGVTPDVTDELFSLADRAYRTEAELAELGLAPGEVQALAVVVGREGVDERVGPVRVVGERDVVRVVESRGRRLTAAQTTALRDHLLATTARPGGDPALPAPRPEPAAEVVVPAPPAAPVTGAAAAVPEVVDVEPWMTWLDPAQAHAVRRSCNGPSRIRGAVGTGKTVVALHRAAYLARARQGAVLLTTYTRTLPATLRPLLARLAPDVADAVEVAGVHEVAARVLAERGVACRIDASLITAAWTTAWGQVGAGSVIDDEDHDQVYWHDEVTHVIKGRGLTRFEQYAMLPRRGRRHQLDGPARRVVWDLHEAYARGLADRGVHDLADQVALAQAELAARPEPGRYAAVVVDEVQDLSTVALRLLHGLVGDAPDGLTLVGDGQQTVYPGGFALDEAGIDVGARTTVLDVHHRSTAQVLQLASTLVAGETFPDVDGTEQTGDTCAPVQRQGPSPVWVRCANEVDRTARLVRHVQELVTAGVPLGQVGVLALSRAGADHAVQHLRRAGLHVVRLEQHDGSDVDAVRVGAVKHAKGLELAHVLLADVAAEWLDRSSGGLDDVARERREHRRRELYVAMTRARDGLWVATV
ncbi:UvrD-helicase domain-containing protein [Cellulomonas sp. SLBN-39]|uniref:UvrD-helicase domain-containing protein n=1 Tax=Cellulomonas sp. SLBN-39 TaxID=2768446 RepID=UPI00114DF077|nr:UvrD-helicase domain-containing protein [Cellulomonas sp. SLBN-39]TQL02036.1 UvrD-like helicase family protein [Cellulomonas sp. SLBN-39]